MIEPLVAFEPTFALPAEETRSLRLLVVVDDDDAARAVREALEEESADLDVEWVHDVDAALSPLRHRAFDVVVLDLALVGSRSLDLVDEPAIQEGESWLVLVGEPPAKNGHPRRLLARAAHELLPRDERLVESLAGLLRFARRAVAVRARASRYQNLFRHSADGILLFDTRGVVLDANPRALEQLGYAREELLGLRFDALYPAAERRRVLSALEQLAFERYTSGSTPASGTTIALEVPVRRRDGAVFPAEVSIASFHGGGQPLVQAVVRDLSARRALEQRLQEVQKMEALGRLAGGVAHDLNNLLTVIQGYGALLENVVPQGGDARRFLDEVNAAGQRASALTHQLLAFSRRQVLQPRLVDVNEEILRLERLLRATLGEDVRLELELCAELSRVRIDPAQLEQVIVNLAVNARDAMPDGGELTLATDLVPAPGPLTGDDPWAGAPWVRLQARDTGVGMSADVLAHLFEPFFTTKKRGKGTGLGLASVYGAVRQSGGDIRVESVPGMGTTFEVLLPPATDEASPLNETGSHAAIVRPASGSGERVLVVEDDAAVRGLVVAVLRGAGYAVEEAANGDAALAMAGHGGGALDLLLCDVVLPDKSGDEVARRIGELWPSMRTLFMSGHAPRAIARQGRLRPGSRFIAKPFTPEALLQKVARVLARPA
ncbi:MAG TPA: response regulator [Thermoanaerobaculia bacterium]|jgi:hypothetical protein|nr:response regulator [Thermoanaerobaculia bacterium]